MKPGKRERSIPEDIYYWEEIKLEGRKEGVRISRILNKLTAVLCTVLLPWKEVDLVDPGAKG